MTIAFNNARFMFSVARLQQAPPDVGAEVAFAGRSNAGKSSAMNAITNNKKLARTSKTPGRTQLLNYFSLDPQQSRRLVDLPGYGYAQVPQAVKRQWQALLSNYLETRESLAGLVLVMDVRHPLRDFDRQMLNWAAEDDLAVHVLLTKADKLKRGKATSTLLEVRKQLAGLHANASVQLFSATARQGLDEVQDKLCRWLEDA